MLLKFTAGHGLKNYQINAHERFSSKAISEFVNDTVAEVPDSQAKYLLETFPKNFSTVGAKSVDAPTNNKVAAPPQSNRGR